MTDPSYDVHGSGPVLLVLPGGAGHPMGLEPLTRRLAARFTVVVLDPLGLAHGRLGQPVAGQPAAVPVGGVLVRGRGGVLGVRLGDADVSAVVL
ncbi:alpha/beta fold hydrolase, partial [Streptomyces sp. NPDC003487]